MAISETGMPNSARSHVVPTVRVENRRAMPANRGSQISPPRPNKEFVPPSQRVIAAVARHTGITCETLVGKSRLRPVVVARRIAAYILRHRYGWSSTRIAKTLNRDHTTILTGLKRMPCYLAQPTYARQLSAVVAELQLGRGFIDTVAYSARSTHPR